MQNNFNLKSFLTENRITSNSKDSINEGKTDMEYVVDIIKDRAAETGFSEKAEAQELIKAIESHFEI